MKKKSFKVARHSKTNRGNPDDMELPDGYSFPPELVAEVMRQMDEQEKARASDVAVVFPVGD
jgi:hypothetical protein